jgi:hypothetical protein
MLNLFVAHLTPGADGSAILSAETVADTGAQVMTPEQAKAVGFAGLPDYPANVALIVSRTSDRNRILSSLEQSPAVAKFEVHEVDG